MNNRKLSKNANILLANFISPVLAYIIIAFNTYVRYKNYESEYSIDLSFYLNTAKYMFQHITGAFPLLFLPTIFLPFLLILYIVYIYIFYKTYASKNNFIKKYQLLLFIILLVLLYLFLDWYSSLIVSAI